MGSAMRVSKRKHVAPTFADEEEARIARKRDAHAEEQRRKREKEAAKVRRRAANAWRPARGLRSPTYDPPSSSFESHSRRRPLPAAPLDCTCTLTLPR